jgi:oxygen-independent coproporphyrinogen-3 oxidase
VVYGEELAKSYVEALKREIELVGSTGHGRKQVNTLYFGGGSPALVAGEIEGIVNKVRDYFEITDGIGLELHPSDVTEENLLLLKTAGITRISIGIQSFQPEYLELLGRNDHDYRKMFDALSKVPFETVAMDFIFALPGQSIDSLKKDIDTAFSNGANHIALYPFIDFTYTNRNFKKMPERYKKRLLEQITDYCTQQGYHRDSIWTFAKPGTKKYSSMTRDNFLGFGCSATTLLKDQFKINTFSIPAYIDRINSHTLPTALTLKFTKRQRMIYYLFWTAYTTVVDAEDFRAFFDEKLERYYGFELLVSRMLGFVKKKDNTYSMTPRGAYFYHCYENFYTLSYIDQMWSLMRNTDFPEELVIK